MINPELMPMWLDAMKRKAASRLLEATDDLTEDEAEAFVEAVMTEHKNILRGFDGNTVIDYIES